MKLAAVAVIASLSACGTRIQEAVINPAPAPMLGRPAAAVEVFTSGAPTRRHTDVSVLEAQVGSTGLLIAALRQRAADRGCDGLVVTGIRPGLGEPRVVTGTCIVWQPDSIAASEKPH